MCNFVYPKGPFGLQDMESVTLSTKLVGRKPLGFTEVRAFGGLRVLPGNATTEQVREAIAELREEHQKSSS